LIEPSRIFPQNDRELRDLTRHRESLVKARTDQKNHVRRVLDSACIKLSSVLSNLFGKAGMVVIKGLLNGEDIDKILEKNPSKILKRKEMELREAIKSELSPAQIFVIGQGLEIIDEYDRQIMELDATLVDKMKEKMEDLKILMSVPRTLRKFVSEHFLWGFWHLPAPPPLSHAQRCNIWGTRWETKTNEMRFSTEPDFCNYSGHCPK
jgi:transposase